MKKLSSARLSYIAGFLDGDGSVYIKLTKNKTYRFKYQVSSYIVFYQSSINIQFLQNLQKELSIGYVRKRNDGVSEFIIGDEKSQLELIEKILPYTKLKLEQLQLMKKILRKKKFVKCADDFLKLCGLIDGYKNLNYSKKRSQNSIEVRKVLVQNNLITP